MLISLTGFMGCGKSSAGKHLAELLDAEFVDLDEAVVRAQSRSIPEIFESGGEVLFRKIEFEVLQDILARSSDRFVVLALGGGTMTYDASRNLLLSETTVVYLKTELSVIKARLGEADDSRPLFRNADELYEKRRPVYEQAAISVDTGDKSPEEVAELIVKAVFPSSSQSQALPLS